MVGGGPFDLKPGQWTDDTSMALALADSLTEVPIRSRDLMDRYVRWWREGVLLHRQLLRHRKYNRPRLGRSMEPAAPTPAPPTRSPPATAP